MRPKGLSDRASAYPQWLGSNDWQTRYGGQFALVQAGTEDPYGLGFDSSSTGRAMVFEMDENDRVAFLPRRRHALRRARRLLLDP